VLLKNGYGATTPFVLNIVFLFIGHTIFSMLTTKRQIPFFSVTDFFKGSLMKCTIVTTLSIPLPIFFHSLMQEGLCRFIMVFSISILCTLLNIFFIGLNSKEKTYMFNLISTKIKNK
jgi:hypothetical protein